MPSERPVFFLEVDNTLFDNDGFDSDRCALSARSTRCKISSIAELHR
jgi:hypothetical protein